MRIILLFIFCSTISLTASAQWWKLKKLPPRPAELATAQIHIPQKFMPTTVVPHPYIKASMLSPSNYSLEVAQNVAMKTAQHNMRFRIYDLASYNFSDLAQLYVQQNRFSEAKWYFLQSIFLSRQQNNYKLTLSNLIKLAKVKADIGDFALAKQDLLEARNLAAMQGWLFDLVEVEKKLSYMQHTRFATLRGNMRYADMAEEN